MLSDFDQFLSAYHRQHRRHRYPAQSPAKIPSVLTVPHKLFDVHSLTFLKQLAKLDEDSNRRLMDLRNPSGPALSASTLADALPAASARLALARTTRRHPDSGDTVAKLHAFVHHAAGDLAFDHVRPTPHTLPDGSQIHRFSSDDVRRLKDTQEQIKAEILKHLGYHGMVYHDSAGRPVYQNFDDGPQNGGTAAPRQPSSFHSDMEQFSKAYYQQVEKYRREGAALHPKQVADVQTLVKLTEQAGGQASSKLFGSQRSKWYRMPPHVPSDKYRHRMDEAMDAAVRYGALQDGGGGRMIAGPNYRKYLLKYALDEEEPVQPEEQQPPEPPQAQPTTPFGLPPEEVQRIRSLPTEERRAAIRALHKGQQAGPKAPEAPAPKVIKPTLSPLPKPKRQIRYGNTLRQRLDHANRRVGRDISMMKKDVTNPEVIADMEDVRKHGISGWLHNDLQKYGFTWAEMHDILPVVLEDVFNGVGSKQGKKIRDYDESLHPEVTFWKHVRRLVNSAAHRAQRTYKPRPENRTRSDVVTQPGEDEATSLSEAAASNAATSGTARQQIEEAQEMAKRKKRLAEMGQTEEPDIEGIRSLTESQEVPKARSGAYLVPFKTHPPVIGRDKYDNAMYHRFYEPTGAFQKRVKAVYAAMPPSPEQRAVRQHINFNDLGRIANWVYSMRRSGFTAKQMAGDPTITGWHVRYKAMNWLQQQVADEIKSMAERNKDPSIYERFRGVAKSKSQTGIRRPFSKELSGPWVPYTEDHDALRQYINERTARRELPKHAPQILDTLLAGGTVSDAARDLGKSKETVGTAAMKLKAMIPEFYETTGRPDRAQEFRDKINRERVVHAQRMKKTTIEPPAWPKVVPQDDAGKLKLLAGHIRQLYPSSAENMVLILAGMYEMKNNAEIAAKIGLDKKHASKVAQAMVRTWRNKIANYVRINAQRLGDQRLVDRLAVPLSKNKKIRQQQIAAMLGSSR